MCTSSWWATANPRRSGSSSKPGAPAGSRRCSRNVSVHSPHRIARPRRFARNGGLSVEAHSMSTTRKALRPSSTTYARHKIMQINLNPTSERGASRDAVNRPRETLGDSHLISSDPRSRFGLVCDLLCCRGNIVILPGMHSSEDTIPNSEKLSMVSTELPVSTELRELRRRDLSTAPLGFSRDWK